MNIFLYELKAYSKNTIVWTIALIMLVFLLLSLFPSFAKEAVSVQKLLKGYPEAVRKALGISISNISSFLGFYSFVFVYVVLCGAIQAMNLGIGILSKETRAKAADFLFTKPAARSKVMTAKLLASLSLIIITNTIYLMAATLIASMVSEKSFDAKIFGMISLTLFFIQLMFMALGVVIAVLISNIKSVIPISLGTVFGFFMISMFGSVVEDDAMRYMTPFKYFDTAYIIKHSAYESSFMMVALLFISVALLISYGIYSRKDKHTV
ncbi:MAG: transporter permease [Clostridia bacterium]|jgi:ABC-2 type transport system permease protein|nr:transporter permease [Clostridia bacterium]